MKILMSIKPEYANAIMNGAKKWEFRKSIPKGLSCGDVVVVYSSSPERMVLGEFEVGRILGSFLPACKEFSSLWEEVDASAYITYKSLLSYAGDSFVHAVQVKSVTRYNRPRTLNECFPGINRPPQNFRYIDNPDEYKRAVIVNGIIYKPHRTHPHDPGHCYNVEHEICGCCDLQRGGGLGCDRTYCMGFLDGDNCGVYLKRYARIEGGVIKKLKGGEK